MINFYNQVPSVYTSASRDFQYLSWLINIVLNSVKHNVDDLYNLPNAKNDPRLTELLAMTLGFKVKRNYNQEQLKALVSILPSLLKYKGTDKAIDLAGNALIKASGAEGIFKHELVNNCLEIQLPETLVDTILFIDLLPYILPAGITVRVVTKTESRDRFDPIEVGYEDEIYAAWKTDLDWDADHQTPIGLSMLFKEGVNEPEFANFKHTIEEAGSTLNLNAGLLDNTIIPTLENTLEDKKTQGLVPATTSEEEE